MLGNTRTFIVAQKFVFISGCRIFNNGVGEILKNLAENNCESWFASELFKSSCVFFIKHIFSVYLIVFGFANLLMCRAMSSHGTNQK